MVRRSGVLYAYYNGIVVGALTDTTNIGSIVYAFAISRNMSVQYAPAGMMMAGLVGMTRGLSHAEVFKAYRSQTKQVNLFGKIGMYGASDSPGGSPVPVFLNHYREMGIC